MGETSVERIADTTVAHRWKVVSFSAPTRQYTVALDRDAVGMYTNRAFNSAGIREHIWCSCPGHSMILEKQREGRVCKHCGAVLFRCLLAWNPSLMATLLQLESTPEITNLMIGNGDAEGIAPRRGRSQVQAGGRKPQDRAMPRAQSKKRIVSARHRQGTTSVPDVEEEALLAITYEPERGQARSRSPACRALCRPRARTRAPS